MAATMSSRGVSPSKGTTRSTAAKRGEHRHPVVERVERPVVALAQALDRRVGIDRDDQRRAEAARLLEVGDVAAVQQVEHAVGHDERPRQSRDARKRVRARRDLERVSRRGAGRRASGFDQVAVLEDLDDAHDARRRRGDLAGGVAFLPRDDAHQVDDAALGDDLDRVGRKLVGLDHARLHLRRDVRVVGARRQVGVRRHDQLVAARRGPSRCSSRGCRRWPTRPGPALRRSAARRRCSS